MQKPLFINKFQKGSSENANLGFGTFLGVENYTSKGVVRLTKDTTQVGAGTITDLIVYIVLGTSTSNIFAQGTTGRVYYSTDSGLTWTNITGSPITLGTNHGRGLIFYKNYLFSFNDGKIYYCESPYGSGDWHSFKTGLTGNNNPFIFPNNNSVYFCNGNTVGKIGMGTDPTFDPSGTLGTDYYYSASELTGLPDNYIATCLSFLSTNFIVIGTKSNRDSTVSDIILWNPTLSTYETPLRLYSLAPEGENGVIQLINRNNTLIAITGGNHAIFETNGTTFNQIANLSLHSNIRKSTGTQSQSPVVLSPRVSAIDIMGDKLLTGVSTPSDDGYYPSGYGLYPCGVWTVAFMGSDKALQCEYVISTGTTTSNNDFFIGAIKSLGTQALISWKDNTSYGLDLVSFTDYQNNINEVAIESEMMEIGTPLEPETVQTIQMNCPRDLVAGQTVSFYYRTGFDQDYTLIESFTSANNNDNGYKIIKNQIGATRFLQLQVRMATTSTLTLTPEIRNIIVSP